MSSADIAAILSRGRRAKKFVSLLLWDFWCENQSGMGILTFEGVSFGGCYESFFFCRSINMKYAIFSFQAISYTNAESVFAEDTLTCNIRALILT